MGRKDISPLEIVKNDVRMKYLNPLIQMQSMDKRAFDEDNRHRPDGQFQRDYARIMYSSSFRRLQGKMQLLGIKNDQFFRNRLTHSLEVAQIARSIAYTLGYDMNEMFIVEAGALAHDIGNPPFGHAGEKCLHNRFIEIGGFEGNAQTLRILTNIEKKSSNYRGLNLTYRTLFSIVKYFKKYDKQISEGQKFIYDSDYDFLNSFIDKQKLIVRTIDVQIVDIADEIAYAAHDLEDGLRVKAFTIDEILHDYQAQYGQNGCFNALYNAVNQARDKSGFGKKIDSSEYSKLFRQEISSSLINMFLNDIDLVKIGEEHKNKTGTLADEELGFGKYKELVSGLKKIVFSCINHNDEVYSYEEKGKEVIETLCDKYSDTKYLPPEYRECELKKQYEDLRGVENLQERLICDYVSGMMDSYAITCFEKITGKKFADK